MGFRLMTKVLTLIWNTNGGVKTQVQTEFQTMPSFISTLSAKQLKQKFREATIKTAYASDKGAISHDS